MSEAPAPLPTFRSAEEFAEHCAATAARLHWLNRVGMGEQVFVAELAELIRQAGAALAEFGNDPETRARFGDGWTKGSLSPEDRRAAVLALMTRSKS